MSGREVNDDFIRGVRIRMLREEDLPALEWQGEYACYRRVYREVYRAMLRGTYKPMIAETEADGLIGQVFLSLRMPNPQFDPNHPFYFLTSLRVKPPYRDRGVGRLLLRNCCSVAWNDRIPGIYLHCASDNLRGCAFYERNGFTKLRRELCRWSYADQYGEIQNECQPAFLYQKQV